MTEITVLIYFAVNIFMAGYFFNEHSTFETPKKIIFSLFFNLFFGTILLVIYPIVTGLDLAWMFIEAEIKFQYKLRFKNYWDKVMLDDDYSPVYKNLQEKLEYLEKMKCKGQLKRHNKTILNKYSSKL